MSLQLNVVEKVAGLTENSFKKGYLNKHPVVITDICPQWPAHQKWTLEYFKEKAGDKVVDLYNNTKSDPSKSVMHPDARMRFGEYLDLIAGEPTDLRIFLFNVFKHIPEICNDYTMPTLMKGFLKQFPMMFFGGAGSIVHLHFDIDMSHVFMTQFHGKKRVVLFGPEYSKMLYHLPFTVQSYIDVNNPDYENYPALKNVKGYECIVEHGETLYIPSGYWHYMEYLEGGFAISLRALDDSYLKRAEGAINLFVLMKMDNVLKHFFGKKWYGVKERMAFSRAEKTLQKSVEV